MSTGEINYDELMHDGNSPALYVIGHVVLVFFAIAMPILATNLLIGIEKTKISQIQFIIFFRNIII